MKDKLFAYETLTHRGIIKKALGHAVVESRAVLPGYTEAFIGKGKDAYPTLLPSHSIGGNGNTKGDIVRVSAADLAKLDKWEANYRRTKVNTSAGEAWTYIFSRRTPP